MLKLHESGHGTFETCRGDLIMSRCSGKTGSDWQPTKPSRMTKADERSGQIGVVVCNLACAGEYFEMAMRFVDAVEVRKVLTFPVLIAALEAAHGCTKTDFKTGSSAAREYFVRHAVDCSRGLGATKMTRAIRGDPELSGSN